MRYLIIWLSCLLSVTALVGQSRYNFFTIGTEQGLSNPDIWAINQDKHGYIWIGTTNGLNRYDGHSIKQYYHKDEDKTTIPGNAVYWIYRDTDNEMWFACGAAGLARYNYTTDNFQSLAPYDSARKFNAYGGPVWRFGEDHQKRIYLSSGAACYRYDKRSGKFDELTAMFSPALQGGIGKFIMQDDNIMWMATDDGLYKYDIPANKIQKISYDVEKLTYGSSRIFDASFISNDELLLTVDRAAFIIYNTRTQKFRPADGAYDPAKSARYTQMGAALKDSRGRFWLTSSVDGLVEYFPKEGKYFSLKKEMLYPYPYPEQEGSGKSIFEDRNGNLWYGTSTRGAIRFQPDFDFISVFKRDYAKSNSLPGNSVSAIYPDPRGGMWIGTERGICKYDRSTNSYTNFPVLIPGSEYPSPGIRSLTGNRDTLYITTNVGINRFYNAKFSRYINSSDSAKPGEFALFNNDILYSLVLPSGDLLLLNDQLARFSPSTGKCYFKGNTSGDPLYDFTGVTNVLLNGAKDKIWLSANKKDLYSYELQTGKTEKHRYAPDDSSGDIQTIALDKNNTLWIGTPSGLASYDPETKAKSWHFFAGGIRNLNCDSEKWIWFSSQYSIGRMNRSTGVFETFAVSNLLPGSSLIKRTMTMDASGDIWIGTNQGFMIIDTGKFHTLTAEFFPSITNFKVFDEVKYFDEPYSELKDIRLGYGENFFSFEFSSFNFTENKDVHYAYMLEGFDKDWHHTTRNGASYTNVPSGDYTLHIKAMSGPGNWYEMKYPVKLSITPPFWKTAWFFIFCMVLLAVAIYWTYRARKRNLDKRNIEKTIDYFANSVYGENSINEICWDIARNCISQLEFEDCVVYLVDENSQKLVQKAAYGPKNPKGHEIADPIEIEMGKGIVGYVAATGKPLLINDTSKDSRYIVDDEQRLAELSVPILHDGKVIGVIDSEHHQKNFFTLDHLKAMTTIASISANKVAEAQAEASAKENEIKLLEIKKMLAESQLMALRAQMNPHFVFNCLNSIQECIVTEKYGEASKYLNKFSKLFRTVLNNSGRNLVTLEEEVEVLDLYLQLEQMRFEKSFEYTIIKDEDLEMDEILIPSMLLQPYVENALWHGLMHKDGDRKLVIEFKRINEDVFRCTIDDNGIGRQRSFELKEQQSKSKRHESKGLKISRDRINILQKQGYHATLDIIDKYDEAGMATGTTVIAELSTFLKI